MFGLFGKSGFDAEMAELDKKHKKIGDEILVAMNGFQIERQMSLLLAMAEVCDQKAKCCNKYGKFDQVQKWEDAKKSALALHG